jgi:sugar phosphate isomerase/epimerase
MNNDLGARLAVCSWSLQPQSPQDLVAKLQETGLRRVQLALDPLRDSPGVWRDTPKLLQQHGIRIVSGMLGFPGEDYTTPDTIRVTGGVAPDQDWPENWQRVQATAALAQELGLKLVSFHAGFLPHDAADPNAAKMQDRLAQAAGAFAARGIVLALETGQETAPVLVRLLQSLARANLAVNFDPANMILYDKGEPLEALETLAHWIRQIHIKDARRTKIPGAWGEELPAGAGEVDWAGFFGILRRLGYAGDLVIEREAGSQRVADIRLARQVVEKAYQQSGAAPA